MQTNKSNNLKAVKTTAVKENIPVNIGLKEKDAASSAMILNILLSDEHVLYIKTRNYHWNVQGKHFRELHSLFEEQYTRLEEIIDEVAERVRQLGYFAVGSLSAFQSLTNLTESDKDIENEESMIRNLVNDHETIIRTIRENIDKTDSYKDFGTTDFITGVMEVHEKMVWMLRSHLSSH